MHILDWLYYGCIGPAFEMLANLLSLVFILPLTYLSVPVWLHVMLISVLTCCLSFFLRWLLNVEEKVNHFNALFTEKRRRQQNLQMISDKYSRQALYKVTDDELNDDFNTYLALHYARYVTVYLLPLFLTLAWINSVFSESMLLNLLGSRFVVNLPDNILGLTGMSVTFIFLLTYILCLIIGFQIKRLYRNKSTNSNS
jgi:Ca2+/Na+ antiporter